MFSIEHVLQVEAGATNYLTYPLGDKETVCPMYRSRSHRYVCCVVVSGSVCVCLHVCTSVRVYLHVCLFACMSVHVHVSLFSHMCHMVEVMTFNQIVLQQR